MPRRPIADMIEDMEASVEPSAPTPQPPAPELAQPGKREIGRPPEARRQRSPRAREPQPVPAARPAARDLAAPARRNIAREALKVDVPAELALLQRLHRRRLDTGMDIRDQVAIAVDEWLTAGGY